MYKRFIICLLIFTVFPFAKNHYKCTFTRAVPSPFNSGNLVPEYYCEGRGTVIMRDAYNEFYMCKDGFKEYYDSPSCSEGKLGSWGGSSGPFTKIPTCLSRREAENKFNPICKQKYKEEQREKLKIKIENICKKIKSTPKRDLSMCIEETFGVFCPDSLKIARDSYFQAFYTAVDTAYNNCIAEKTEYGAEKHKVDLTIADEKFDYYNDLKNRETQQIINKKKEKDRIREDSTKRAEELRKEAEKRRQEEEEKLREKEHKSRLEENISSCLISDAKSKSSFEAQSCHRLFNECLQYDACWPSIAFISKLANVIFPLRNNKQENEKKIAKRYEEFLEKEHKQCLEENNSDCTPIYQRYEKTKEFSNEVESDEPGYNNATIEIHPMSLIVYPLLSDKFFIYLTIENFITDRFSIITRPNFKMKKVDDENLMVVGISEGIRYYWFWMQVEAPPHLQAPYFAIHVSYDKGIADVTGNNVGVGVYLGSKGVVEHDHYSMSFELGITYSNSSLGSALGESDNLNGINSDGFDFEFNFSIGYSF